jgi:hypothetical protein
LQNFESLRAFFPSKSGDTRIRLNKQELMENADEQELMENADEQEHMENAYGEHIHD